MKALGETKIDTNQKLDIYIKYLKQEQAINRSLSLDHFEIKILNEILFAQQEGNSLRVSDVLAMKNIASPATLHAALKKLAHKGLIDYRLVSDSRVKYLQLTKLGIKRFLELASVVELVS